MFLAVVVNNTNSTTVGEVFLWDTLMKSNHPRGAILSSSQWLHIGMIYLAIISVWPLVCSFLYSSDVFSDFRG